MIRLPKDKCDTCAVEELRKLPIEALAPHIPAMLEWVQDINLPVARPVAGLLATLGKELIEPVREVLNGDDPIWKTWVLSAVLCEADPEVRIALRAEVSRLIEQLMRPGKSGHEILAK